MPKKPRKLLKSAGGSPPKVAEGPTGFPARKARDEAKARGREPSKATIVVGAKTSFIACYDHCGSKRRAARAAGVSRSQVYAWIAEDPAFAKAVRLTQDELNDEIDDELYRRGIVGTERLKFDKGNVIMIPTPEMVESPTEKDAEGKPKLVPKMVPYVELETSDRCLELLAKANNPKKYREKIDHQLEGEVVLKVVERQLRPEVAK